MGKTTRPSFVPEARAEESVTLVEGKNKLVLHLEEQTWTSILAGENEIVREKSPDPVIGYVLPPGQYIVRTDGRIKKVSSRTPSAPATVLEQFEEDALATLYLSSDAPDRHVVDGIGEIPADGKSFCTLTLEKVGPDGQRLIGKEHDDEIFLRSTGGLLKGAGGRRRIRSLRLESGRAQFRLISEKVPRLVTVTAFGREQTLREEIQIEFI